MRATTAGCSTPCALTRHRRRAMLPSLLLLLPCAAASAVVDLDSDSVDQSLKRQRAFIKFFAPWCPLPPHRRSPPLAGLAHSPGLIPA